MKETKVKTPETLYCPYCGQLLTISKWGDSRAYDTCVNGHVFSRASDLCFSVIHISTCECGEKMPANQLREVDKRQLCPKCFEVARREWQMDKDKSYARFEITPVDGPDGSYYSLSTSIEIKPYPNPFMFGGMYGGGRAKDDQELAELIKAFENMASEYQTSGLEKIEIVRRDRTTIKRQIKMIDVKPEKPKETPAKSPEIETKKQLSLMI